MFKSYLFMAVFLVVSIHGITQPGGGSNSTCETADPFCTGTTYSFPAGVNSGSGQPGPYYACLLTTPNPAWYYMKVALPGNIIISMHSEPNRDIDFCCWGPFPTQNSCTQLTSGKVVSCSYSPSWTETCTIPNGQTGEYYILIITNFSNLPCNIIFSQTGGTGTTDCTILPPPCTSNSPICVGQTLQLSANSVNNATYHWTGPNGFTSSAQNPSIPDAQLVNAGDYYLRITVNSIPSSDSSKTTVHIYDVVSHAGNDTAIQNGVFTKLHGSASGGCGAYHYHWSPEALLVDPDLQIPTTVNLFTPTIFTLKITDDSAGCTANDNVTINISGGALGVGATANPGEICYGATAQLQALASGGAGNYTYQWTGTDGFSSTLQNPTVQPNATTTYTVVVGDGYNNASNTVTLTVNPLPVANAGSNKSIPYGTYIWLDGSVSGGNSNYFYSWSPPDKLVNPNIQDPQTINLEATTIFSLVVTDLVKNCVSTNQANVTIEVTGGPLGVNPVATPDWICTGDTTQLHALAGGGNVGYYQYSWVSDPPGFQSSDPDPYVTPVVNTTYSVSVYDGFNTVNGNTTVSIYPQPYIHLGPPDSTVCIYQSVTLDAGNPGSIYIWSNGETTQTISISATGIVYETQSYTVRVTNEDGCISVASISVNFSYNACTGINEQSGLADITIFPNPGSGVITFEGNKLRNNVDIEIFNLTGSQISGYLLYRNPNGLSSLRADLSALSKGIYIIRFKSDNLLRTNKLVIE